MIIQTKEKEVRKLLDELNKISYCEDFDIDNDLIIIFSKKDKVEFSTQYTLVDLEYDRLDILDILRSLTVRNYSHTLLDRDDENPPILYVFGKFIENRLVYIKIKLKEEQKKMILCLSFHYAREDMYFPYK